MIPLSMNGMGIRKWNSSNPNRNAITKFVATVSSLTKTEHEYDIAEEYYKDRETYGIMAPYGDMNGSPVFTRSEEEKRICTWLSEHDVKFLYEQHYPIQTSDTAHRQYKPDFTIYYTKEGKQYYLFLEHSFCNYRLILVHLEL